VLRHQPKRKGQRHAVIRAGLDTGRDREAVVPAAPFHSFKLRPLPSLFSSLAQRLGANALDATSAVMGRGCVAHPVPRGGAAALSMDRRSTAQKERGNTSATEWAL
jgi:hypothetical protein